MTYPVEFFWRATDRYPERTAVVGPGRTLTFRELARAVLERAGAIMAEDPAEGGIVCVGAANTIDHLVSILAVLAAGKTWAPLNPRNGDPELERLIDFVRPSLILADQAMGERIGGQGRRIRLLSQMTNDAGDPVPMGPAAGVGYALDRTQAIKFTGGTTGFPKGVKQPLRAWNTCIVTQIHALGLTADDRYLVASPLTHGASTYMLPVLGSGAAIVFPEDPSPAGLLDAIERHGVSFLFAPPTLLVLMTEQQRRAPRDLSGLRRLIYGGGPMRVEQIRAAQACFGDVLCTTYGQTEAPQIATFLSPAQMVGDDLASVGRATILTEVGILAEDGRRLPPGEKGEVAIRGDLLMTGYLDAPEETARSLVGGWLRTGDAGVIDERGFLFLKDRIRDVIITGGFNVYPADVEVVISSHPAVVDCSVVGVPDEKWGEAVHAAVQLRPGHEFHPAELTAMLKHALGSVKTPKQIHIFDKLPASAVGKVLKPAIREEILRRRNIETGSSQ